MINIAMDKANKPAGACYHALHAAHIMPVARETTSTDCQQVTRLAAINIWLSDLNIPNSTVLSCGADSR